MHGKKSEKPSLPKDTSEQPGIAVEQSGSLEDDRSVLFRPQTSHGGFKEAALLKTKNRGERQLNQTKAKKTAMGKNQPTISRKSIKSSVQALPPLNHEYKVGYNDDPMAYDDRQIGLPTAV